MPLKRAAKELFCDGKPTKDSSKRSKTLIQDRKGAKYCQHLPRESNLKLQWRNVSTKFLIVTLVPTRIFTARASIQLHAYRFVLGFRRHVFPETARHFLSMSCTTKGL